MSSVIHMDTEQVRSVAGQLIQASSDIQQDILSIGNRLRGLNWLSPSRDRFISDVAELQRRVQVHAEMGAELGFRMQREVDEWVAVDSGHPFGGQGDGKTTVGEGSNFIEWLHGNAENSKLLLELSAMAYIAVRAKDYAGEIKFFGPKWVKELAGISGTLTISSAEGFTKNLVKEAGGPLTWGVAALEWGGKAIDDWTRYERGSEKTTALVVDAAFVVGKTVGETAFQSWVMGTLGIAALGTIAAAGAPAVLVVGAGFGIWWVSGQVFSKAADAIYGAADSAGIKDAIVQTGGKIIDGAIDLAGKAAQGAADAVDSSFKGITKGISNLFG